MRPIALSGHSRALTHIKYNLEGDLIFSAAKDHSPSLWWSHNGERVGSFDGHNGTVWCLDPLYDTSLLISGSADNSCKIWDVRTGVAVSSLETKSAVRSCGWSYSGENFFYSTDKAMGQPCTLNLYSLSSVKQQGSAAEPYLTIASPDSKITSAVWGPVDETIITGHENGMLKKWDAKTGEEINKVRHHTANINDIQYNKDMTAIITASKDNAAKLFDVEKLRPLKTFQTERPVNSACISPLKQHVVLGGGQDAMSVTTTAGSVGKFEATFYHMIFMEEIGKVKGHFGPINTLAFRPDGKGYTSGGEDGYIRIHDFDQSYFDFEFEVE